MSVTCFTTPTWNVVFQKNDTWSDCRLFISLELKLQTVNFTKKQEFQI